MITPLSGRRRIAGIAGFLSICLAGLGFSAPLPVGVQRTDLAWHADGDAEAADAMIASIAKAGPTFVRLNVRVRDNFEAVARHIRTAQANDLGVLLQLAHSTDPSVYPPGTEKRPGRDALWPSFPISQTDPAAFEAWLDDLFAVLKREGAIPQIVQTGNEINWCAFNGDYPLMPEGEGTVFAETEWDALPDAVRVGARKSGLIAAITARKMREWFPDASQRPKVILGSLNKPDNPEWLARIGGTFLLPETFLAIANGSLKGSPERETEDYLQELDGISLHFYPPAGNRNAAARRNGFRDYLRAFMDPVRKVTPLPTHITEFGFERSGFQNDRERAVALGDFVKELERQPSRSNLASVAIFSWDQMDYALVDPGTGEIDPAFVKALGWSPR